VALGFALATNTTGSDNSAVGWASLYYNTTGSYNTAMGRYALFTNTTADNNTAVGYQAAYSNATGGNLTAIGYQALYSTTAANNLGIGYQAGYTNTSGTENAFIGLAAAQSNTTGSFNTAIGGRYALDSNTTGARNTSVGHQSMRQNTTGNYNTSVGRSALYSNTTADNNTAVGNQALYTNAQNFNVAMGHVAGYANTTGYITAIGSSALQNNTTGTNNVAVGGYNNAVGTLRNNTTGSQNTGVGYGALVNNTTAGNNTAVGYQALYSHVNSDANSQNTALGYKAGYAATGYTSTFIGGSAGLNATTGLGQTFVGYGAGADITTGSKNTIIGTYGGNVGGLDLRTANNYIVLSDGDGNPRQVIDSVGRFFVGTAAQSISSTQSGEINSVGQSGFAFVQSSTTAGNFAITCLNQATGGTRSQIRFLDGSGGGTERGSITTNGTSTAYNTTSDYRLKENVIDLTGAADRVQQLAPKRFNFIADADKTVDGFLAHEVADIVPEAITGTHNEVDADGNAVMQGIDQSKLVPLLTAALQEALTKIDALETRIVALEA